MEGIMAEGIILAGGFSLRAKTNKMLLNIDDKPIIIHTINGMKPFVKRIILVTGHYDREIREILKNEQVEIYTNKDYEKGMFSSVLTGVKQVTDDFFIIPGDIPFVKKETYQSLLNGSKEIRFPVYKGKQGHPLFIKKELIDDLLKEPVDSNLKLFRDKHEKEMIEVDDPNTLKDIDTIDEYQKIIKERNKAI